MKRQSETFKKAQGLPISTIIIFIIGLLVLVIIAVIFIGRSGLFGASLKSCTGQGGTCSTDSCGEGQASVFNHDCREKNQGDYCCIPVEEKT